MTGEYQLYVRDVATGETTQVTTDLDRKVYHPRWSPDGKKILFGDKDFSLHVVDLATKKRTKIDESRYLDNDEFTWEVSDYAWSPDSRWVAYSLPRENRNNANFLYDTVEGRKVQLTDDFYENLNPRFDADGARMVGGVLQCDRQRRIAAGGGRAGVGRRWTIPRDAVIDMAGDGSVVHQKDVRDVAEPPHGLDLVGADRLIAQIAAGGDDREARLA